MFPGVAHDFDKYVPPPGGKIERKILHYFFIAEAA